MIKIHPLDHRGTAFAEAGYWVIEEISKAVFFNIDWKTDYSTLKYSDDLKTLAEMFDKYDFVEVQESKNGYIFDKTEIEAGYAYYHYDWESVPTPPDAKGDVFINPLTLTII